MLYFISSELLYIAVYCTKNCEVLPRKACTNVQKMNKPLIISLFPKVFSYAYFYLNPLEKNRILLAFFFSIWGDCDQMCQTFG